MPRKTPYTERGLARLLCVHCKTAKASEQWRKDFCADNHEIEWLPLCLKCDVELNRFLLEFFNVADVEEKLKRYEESKKNADLSVKT